MYAFPLANLNFVCHPHLSTPLKISPSISLNSGYDGVLIQTLSMLPISRRHQQGRRAAAPEQWRRQGHISGLFHGLGYRFDQASRWLTRGERLVFRTRQTLQSMSLERQRGGHMGSEIQRRHLRAGFKLDWGRAEPSGVDSQSQRSLVSFRGLHSVPLQGHFVHALIGGRQSRRHRQHQLSRSRPGEEEDRTATAHGNL